MKEAALTDISSMSAAPVCSRVLDCGDGSSVQLDLYNSSARDSRILCITYEGVPVYREVNPEEAAQFLGVRMEAAAV